ncbi:hypothetical protein ACHAWX_000193, partial [Stephanocyclus meneghinianus]
LAWIGIGTFVGFELAAALRTDPYPPTEGSNTACSKCHFIEFDGGLIAKDLFMKYKPFELGGAKPIDIKLIEFYLKWVWFKFCLSTSIERTLTCGKSCCAPTEYCEDSTVPPDVDTDPFRIIHIGDSYSAGTGTGEYTNPPGCYRSIQNWGKLYRDSLPSYIAATYVNRACNGAVMENYFNKRLLETTESPCRSHTQDEVFEDDGVTCKRFVEAQSKAISSDVDLVLMTFGGNDLNFPSIIEQCFAMFYRLDVETCKDLLITAEDSLRSGEFKTMLVKVLRHLGQQLKKPRAKVVLSAYPHVMMDKEYILGVFDKYDAGTAIRDLAVFVDEMQRE